YEFVPGNDLVWLDLNRWVEQRTGVLTGRHDAASTLLLVHGAEQALEVYFQEFEACLSDAGLSAREKSSWPEPPPVRTTLRSKLDLLKVVRERPEMYFGGKSASLLWAYLGGYDLSIADLGQEPDAFNLLDFERWLRMRTGLHGPYRWDRILNFFTFHNDSA